jgi:hypothetical protein
MNAELPPESIEDQTQLDEFQVDEDLALLVAELTDQLQNGKSVDINQVCLEHPLD